MKSLHSLAFLLVIASTTFSAVYAHDSVDSAVPKVAIVSAENDRVLESAVEALQTRNSAGEAKVDASAEHKRTASTFKHRLHRIHKHGEEHVLILGGAEAFSM